MNYSSDHPSNPNNPNNPNNPINPINPNNPSNPLKPDFVGNLNDLAEKVFSKITESWRLLCTR